MRGNVGLSVSNAESPAKGPKVYVIKRSVVGPWEGSRASASDTGAYGQMFSAGGAGMAQTPSQRHHAYISSTRSVSRELAEKHSVVAAYVTLMRDYVLGADTLRLIPEPENRSGKVRKQLAQQIQKSWTAWCNNERRCDYSGMLTFDELVEKLYLSRIVDGEGFFALRQTAQEGLRLELVDAERIPSGFRGDDMIGAQVNDYGRLVNWRVQQRKKLEKFGVYFVPNSTEYEIVPAAAMVQLADLESIDQYRGLPAILPIINNADMLREYAAYALAHAQSASKVLAFLTEGEDPGGIDLSELEKQKIEDTYSDDAITIGRLPRGAHLETSRGTYPSNEFAPFVTHYVEQIAAALGVPAYLLTGSMAGFNFSSARVANMRFKRLLEREQRLLSRCLSRVYRKWLAVEQAYGRLPAGDLEMFLPHRWEWPSLEHIQPREAAVAAQQRIDAGMSSPYQEILAEGNDPEKVAAMQQQSQELGLVSKQPAPPPMQEEDQGEENEDEPPDQQDDNEADDE